MLPRSNFVQLPDPKPAFRWGTDWAAVRAFNDEWRCSCKASDFIACEAIRGRSEGYQQRVWEAIRSTKRFCEVGAVAGDFGAVSLDGEELDWQLVYDPEPLSLQDILNASIRRRIRVALSGRRHWVSLAGKSEEDDN